MTLPDRNDEDYKNYLDLIVSKSRYNSGVNVGVNDRIVTLYTCSYETEKEALDVYMKEMDWLAFSVGNAAKNFYQGCQEYRIIGEDI